MKLLFCIFLLAFQQLESTKIHIVNECNHALHVVIFDHGLSEFSGFELEGDDTKVVDVSSNWEGSIFARTGCQSSLETCETGFCGQHDNCTFSDMSQVVRPFTTAKIHLASKQASYSPDKYGVHIKNGFNRDISIKPITKTYNTLNEKDHFCKETKMCLGNILLTCPQEMKHFNSNGHTIGCYTTCLKKRYMKKGCDAMGTLDTQYRSSVEDNDHKTLHGDVVDFYANKCPDYINYINNVNSPSQNTFECNGKLPNTSADYQVTFCGPNQ
uniref:SCP domain-containing protein n=1 Tax=Rhabditophanes sp. KR3021 TaxID=114890 RepID=A0AC35TFU1_9BILA